MASRLALTSKLLDQAARGQQQQLEVIGQTMARLTSFRRLREQDGLERSAPKHRIRGSSWETAVPRRSELREPGVLFLLAYPTVYSAPQVFVGMPQQGSMHLSFDAMPSEVTWDEEMQDDIDTHEDLLQLLVLGVDGDNTKCKVELDSIMSKDSTRSAVSMHVESKVKHCQGSCPSTLARVEQIMSKTQDDVAVWDKEVEDMLEQHALLQQVALGGNNFVVEDMVSLEAEQVPIQDSVVWDCAQHKGLMKCLVLTLFGMKRYYLTWTRTMAYWSS